MCRQNEQLRHLALLGIAWQLKRKTQHSKHLGNAETVDAQFNQDTTRKTEQDRRRNILHCRHNPVDVARCSADGQFNWDATQGIVSPIAKLFLCHVEIL